MVNSMAMQNKDFVVFILTHGRPDKQITYATIRRIGYTGPIYFIVDSEDSTLPQYIEKFGDAVIVFDKADAASMFDPGDNFDTMRGVVYARNYSFEIARNLGITYFLQLDDDYDSFEHKIDHRFEYPQNHYIVRSTLDRIFDIYLDYYKTINAKAIAMAQCGDFFSGFDTLNNRSIRRKCMNTFFCSVDRPFPFMGRINEDVNAYVYYQRMGNLFLTVPFVAVGQTQTQKTAGGMTDLYLDNGTYVKSFYTVMYAPSCTKIKLMGLTHKRLHHSISWGAAVPCIVGEEHRKAENPLQAGNPLHSARL